jgi:hypothetical protein
VKSIKIKSIVLYASIVAAVIGMIQPINSEAGNGVLSVVRVVYAAEQPSDSIPFCKDERLPIHAFCNNLDSQTLPRYEHLKDLSIDITESILERLDSSR